jgi:hypothetical protein
MPSGDWDGYHFANPSTGSSVAFNSVTPPQETALLPDGTLASRQLGRSVHPRGLFAALALAAVIPILLFAAWTAYVTANREREAARRAVTDIAAQVARRLETEIHHELQIAETLSLSATLDEPHLHGFTERQRASFRLANFGKQFRSRGQMGRRF